jgi:signal transduction histidine kinase
LRCSLATYLAIGYLAVILVSMSVAIPLAWLTLERLYINTQKENLLAQAQLLADALGSDLPQGGVENPYSQAANVLPGIHTRVINPQGAVVIDLTGNEQPIDAVNLSMPRLAQNASGLVTPEELISRPEIAMALSGQAGTAIRSVEVAEGRRVLYAAVPVLSEDGIVSQIVYLASPLPDTQWKAFPVSARWQLAGVVLAAILIASFAGWLLAKRISLPLETMAEATHTIAAGNLNSEVSEDHEISELRVLGKSFNAMTASLRQANLAKNAFISDVSHELRTPLTVIKGTIETLQDGAIDDHAGRGSLLSSMAGETERLIKLVNSLLVLTRADAGALMLQVVPVDLGELVRSRCETFERFAGLRQVNLHLEIQPQPAQDSLRVVADPDRMAQVVDNLLDNAIRYSPPGGNVTITLDREMDRVVCRVTDEGPGIPSEHLPFIFERFYRVDRARVHAEGGAGLGLSIARSLIAAHGGGITASSIEGKGTSVTFWLPTRICDT